MSKNPNDPNDPQHPNPQNQPNPQQQQTNTDLANKLGPIRDRLRSATNGLNPQEAKALADQLDQLLQPRP